MGSQLTKRTSTLYVDCFTAFLTCFFLEGRITKLGVSSLGDLPRFLGAWAAFSSASLDEI